MNNFVPKCLGCKQIIIDTYIQALGGHYHKDCFVCQVHIDDHVHDYLVFKSVSRQIEVNVLISNKTSFRNARSRS
jgi:hypothetical protein